MRARPPWQPSDSRMLRRTSPEFLYISPSSATFKITCSEAALMVAPESVTRYSTLVHPNPGPAEARAGGAGGHPPAGRGAQAAETPQGKAWCRVTSNQRFNLTPAKASASLKGPAQNRVPLECKGGTMPAAVIEVRRAYSRDEEVQLIEEAGPLQGSS